MKEERFGVLRKKVVTLQQIIKHLKI